MSFVLLNPTGGLMYHVKALLFSHTRWKPFKEKIGDWLHRWNPPEKKLIIIGASGGYVLPGEFLTCFSEIIAVDPDPLAEMIFKKRFTSDTYQVQWIKTDFFIKPAFSKEIFQDFLSLHQDAAVLFSNFLGQMPFLIDDEGDREGLLCFWRKNLLPVLKGRSWASFHDRYSSRKRPVLHESFGVSCKLSGDALIKRFYGEDAFGKWVDHQTDGFFVDKKVCDYFVWELTPRAFHIIEGVKYTGRAFKNK